MSLSDKVKELNEKIPKVYETGIEAGRQQEWSDFWDAFQENGTRRNYDYAFRGKWWNDETFKPKYDLIIAHGVGCFTFRGCAITDLEAILKKQNVNLNFWGGNCSECFNSSTITVVPELDVSNISSFYLFFAWCSKLHTIRKLTFKESQTISTGMFDGCVSLANLEIGGVIGSDFKIASSPLTVESAISIITHLKNYKGTENEYTYTLTLSASTNTLLEAEGESSPDNTTWSDYVSSLGWNLA